MGTEKSKHFKYEHVKSRIFNFKINIFKDQPIAISITWKNKHDITVGELNASRESSSSTTLSRGPSAAVSL
jgi:hypothetical protein